MNITNHVTIMAKSMISQTCTSCDGVHNNPPAVCTQWELFGLYQPSRDEGDEHGQHQGESCTHVRSRVFGSQVKLASRTAHTFTRCDFRENL